MEEDIECNCSGKELLIFVCSGGCNVGQLANDAARQLSAEGIGKMACLSAVAGGVSMAIAGAKEAKDLLVIDGCPVQCARKTLEKAGLKPTIHLLVTDLGLKKVDDTNYPQEMLTAIKRSAVEELRKRPRPK
ncbi:MAG: putative zinc-binding protein [Methanomassiliicoccales archaeon]